MTRLSGITVQRPTGSSCVFAFLYISLSLFKSRFAFSADVKLFTTGYLDGVVESSASALSDSIGFASGVDPAARDREAFDSIRPDQTRPNKITIQVWGHVYFFYDKS